MAWTAPRTWVAGEVVTAAMGNQQWRDNLLAVIRPLFANTNVVDVTSTAAETTLFTYTVPAATLAVGAALRLSITGDVLFNDGAQSTTFRVKVGGTTVFSDFNASSAGAGRRPMALTALLSAQSSTTAFLAGTFGIGDATAPTTGLGNVDFTGAPANEPGAAFSSAGTLSYTLANATAVAVTIQHSASLATLSVRSFAAVLEYIPPA